MTLKCTKKWKQRDKTRIRICDMSNEHLLNAVRMLHRVHQEQLVIAYGSASGLQGEMASYYADQEIIEMERRQSMHPLYDDLAAEMERRNLRFERPRPGPENVRRKRRLRRLKKRMKGRPVPLGPVITPEEFRAYAIRAAQDWSWDK